MTSLRFVEKLRDLVGSVEVLLSDIWGVVHNGLEAFPEACQALHNFRKQGGTVILITNAPRPADSVQRQLRKFGVADGTSSPAIRARKYSGSGQSATVRSTAASIPFSRRWNRPITSSVPGCSTTKPNRPKTIAR